MDDSILCMYINYEQLNKVKIMNNYLLPRVDDLFDCKVNRQISKIRTQNRNFRSKIANLRNVKA